MDKHYYAKKQKVLFQMKANRMGIYNLSTTLLLMFLLSACSRINIEKVTSSDTELINKALANDLVIFEEESIVLRKIIKAVNKTIDDDKIYRFGKNNEPINAHFPNLPTLPNQRIVQVGSVSDNSVFLILYDTATAGGMMRRFLIVSKIRDKTYQIYDDCVFPRVEEIEDLKIKDNRCH